MARHRRKPAFRLKGRTRKERSPAAEPRDRRVGVAVRRVVVTPTFAAGLGVVIAAALVYPMSRTVFRYSGPNWGVRQCPASGCVAPRHGAGSPDQAQPGRRLKTGPLRVPPRRSAPSAHGSPPPGTPPVVKYRTVRTWSGGFEGQFTVTFPAGQVPAHWDLSFSYRPGRIIGVVGGRWRQHGHTAEVTGQGDDGQLPSGDAIQIDFWVSGTAGRPARCSFDRQACHYG